MSTINIFDQNTEIHTFLPHEKWVHDFIFEEEQSYISHIELFKKKSNNKNYY